MVGARRDLADAQWTGHELGAARRGIPHWAAYCAAKSGLHGFVRALNAEAAEQLLDVVRTYLK